MSFSINLGSLGRISSSPVSLTVPTVDLKTNFVSRYGSYSMPFDSIDNLGGQTFKTQWPILVAVIGIILSVLSFAGSSREVDPETNELKERTAMKKFLFALGWLLLLSSVFGFGYGAYLYIAVYLPQYHLWFKSLPSEAKASIGAIKTIDSLVNQAANRASRLNRPARN
jgi:hypothetical protein